MTTSAQHILGVVVPYRDRADQLSIFLSRISKYLSVHKIDYRIIVVEQKDTAPFNRGALLNRGYLKAKELGCDYVVFHDVDMLPLKVDYSYSPYPLELVKRLTWEGNKAGTSCRDLTEDYFGGVTLFPNEAFEKINGYSNNYKGWGFEDNDLLCRCLAKGLPLSLRSYDQASTFVPGLVVRGDTFIDLDQELDSKEDFTVSVEFRINSLDKDSTAERKELNILTSKWLRFYYSKFNTYCLEVPAAAIHSKPYPTFLSLRAVICYKAATRKLKLYINGIKQGEATLNSAESSKLSIGNVEDYQEFQLISFAVWKRELKEIEIFNLQNNFSNKGLTQSFEEYSPADLIVYYSASNILDDNTFLDLTGKGHNAEIKNYRGTEPVLTASREYLLSIPYRRQGVFQALFHEDNGYEDTHWRNTLIRKNQIRYNKVYRTEPEIAADGLSTLDTKVQTLADSLKENHYHYLEVKML